MTMAAPPGLIHSNTAVSLIEQSCYNLKTKYIIKNEVGIQAMKSTETGDESVIILYQSSVREFLLCRVIVCQCKNFHAIILSIDSSLVYIMLGSLLYFFNFTLKISACLVTLHKTVLLL